jgi:4-hydroxythreonine-4-phosphate dehydrogenase
MWNPMQNVQARTPTGTKPRIAITLGDPTGIGPEIIVKSIASGKLASHCDLLVVGRPSILRLAAKSSHLQIDVKALKSIDEWTPEDPCFQRNDRVTIACLVTGAEEADLAVEPKIDRRGGQLAFDCLCTAAQLAIAGHVSALVTAPLHKVALLEAGHDWPGHTELLASLCGVDDYAMMLYLPPRDGDDSVDDQSGARHRGGIAGLGVVHVTLHMALRDVFSHLTTSAIEDKIRLAHNAFLRIRIAMRNSDMPRIAVAALNPHGGEGGRFGDEEQSLIAPAVRNAVAAGIHAFGPLPVDTLMPKAAAGAFDAVVAMYHDQGHIALKLLDMFDAVNITLGLPILRTSVAHGTAHDIAWQNKAEASGMVQAILTAARLSHTEPQALAAKRLHP